MAATRPQGRVASRSFGAPPALARSSCSVPLALWFHYGTAVFFEMIAAGIAACF